MDYREEMKQLRDFLNQQSYLYYVLDAPVLTAQAMASRAQSDTLA